MGKMAWERGGTRARWENGEGHMGKVGLPPFCKSGAHFLWRTVLGAPQKVMFMWCTELSAPQKANFLWRIT